LKISIFIKYNFNSFYITANNINIGYTINILKFFLRKACHYHQMKGGDPTKL